MLRETILQMVPLVEAKIGKEMNQAMAGAIMHDGWTCNRMHFIGLVAVYTTKQKAIINGTVQELDQVKSVLLSVAPMQKIEDEVPDDDEIAQFTSQAHFDHIKTIFGYFGVSPEDWIICQIADNASVNRKLAKLLKVPHVGCLSHKFNLDVQDMISREANLKSLLENIKEVVNLARLSLKNAAVIRNMTSVALSTPNETRWSGNCNMISNYQKLWPILKEAAQKEETTEAFSNALNTTTNHIDTVALKAKMLDELNDVTKLLQRRHCSLSNCRLALVHLEDRIAKKKRDVTASAHPLYRCNFARKRCKIDGSLTTQRDAKFENAVCRVQCHQESLLTAAEKTTLRKVLKRSIIARQTAGADVDTDDTADDDSAQNTPGSPGLKAQVEEAERKRAADTVQGSSEYVNLDFVLGSAAEVERLWSLAKYVLTNQRKSMTPLMFEAFMFLKINETFWSEALVIEAYQNARSKKKSARIDKLTQNQQNDAEFAGADFDGPDF